MPDLRNVLFTSTGLILTAGLLMPVANAKPGERESRRGGPPQEAFEACADKAEGDACSFSGNRGDAQGTCIAPPRDEQSLVCAPADGPRGSSYPQIVHIFSE